MILLGIDTSGLQCAVGLRRSGADDASRVMPAGRDHAEQLAPVVAELLDEAGLQPEQIDRIGVVVGPGSFAGARVGVAFARGLALATRAKAVGFTVLDLLAVEAGDVRPLAVIHDAKRGEVIIKLWTDETVEAVGRLPIAEATDKLRGLNGLCVAGGGARLIELDRVERLDLVRPCLSGLLDQTAEAPADSPLPSPFYARPPDAKLPGGLAV